MYRVLCAAAEDPSHEAIGVDKLVHAAQTLLQLQVLILPPAHQLHSTRNQAQYQVVACPRDRTALYTPADWYHGEEESRGVLLL